MIIIGVTGGIAMGKTFVCNLFKEKNIPVYSSDDSIKKIYTFKETLNFLSSLNLNLVINNEINKSKIKYLLVNDIINFNKITNYLHKEEKKIRENFINKEKEKNSKIIILEIPLLFENNLQDNFNYIILVDSPKNIQLSRIKESKKLTTKEIKVILSNQISNKYKKIHSDFIIKTNQDKIQIEKNINNILLKINQK